LTLVNQKRRTETDHRNRETISRVDYHCHISMTEYSDIENPSVISVTKEEFLADLDEADIERAVILSDNMSP